MVTQSCYSQSYRYTSDCNTSFLFIFLCTTEYVYICEFPLLSDMYSAAKPARKRRWGSTSVQQQKPVASINISTDSLKVWLLTAD